MGVKSTEEYRHVLEWLTPSCIMHCPYFTVDKHHNDTLMIHIVSWARLADAHTHTQETHLHMLTNECSSGQG